MGSNEPHIISIEDVATNLMLSQETKLKSKDFIFEIIIAELIIMIVIKLFQI